MESSPKGRKYNVSERVRITKYKNNITDSVLKTNPWTYKIKNLNGEKIIVSFSAKELLLSISLMSYYPESDSCIRDKVNVVSDLSNYATKNN